MTPSARGWISGYDRTRWAVCWGRQGVAWILIAYFTYFDGGGARAQTMQPQKSVPPKQVREQERIAAPLSPPSWRAPQPTSGARGVCGMGRLGMQGF